MHFFHKAKWLMIPSVVGFMLFYIIPFIGSFYYAFTENAFNPGFVGLKNFVDVFQNPIFMLALGNTVRFTLLGVTLIMLFSLLVSFMLFAAGPGYSFLRLAFVLPMLLPTAGLSLIWRVIFNAGGHLNFSANVSSGFWGEIFSPQLVPLYLLFIWKYCGFNIVLMTSAMTAVPREVYEAARLDGAGSRKLLSKITVPLISPSLFFCAVLSVVNSFRIYKEIYYFFGGDYPPNSVYMIQHFMNNQFGKMNFQLLSTGAIEFTGMIFVLLLFGFRFSKGRV